MTAIFKREVRSCFHGMIGCGAHRLYAGGNGYLFCGAESGLWPAGFWLLHALPYHVCAACCISRCSPCAPLQRNAAPAPTSCCFTSPVSVGGIVLGKYFALCVIFALPCLVDAGMILVLKALGATGTSTLANFFCPAVLLSHGLRRHCHGVFLSSLTENQIIAAVAWA